MFLYVSEGDVYIMFLYVSQGDIYVSVYFTG